jgi:Flp pilus assembly protein TadG
VIAGWLVKIVVVIALVGFAAFELGSPLITRAQLDSTAHDAADEAARVYANTHDQEKACDAANELASHESVTVTACDSLQEGTVQQVRVTVFKEAKSYLLKKFGPTKDWYGVTITVKSIPENK